jgi:hypothetical protein
MPLPLPVAAAVDNVSRFGIATFHNCNCLEVLSSGIWQLFLKTDLALSPRWVRLWVARV